MTTTQDPVNSADDLSAYINKTETDTIEFMQVAALDTQNQFVFSESTDSTPKTPVAAKAIDPALTQDQANALIVQWQAAGYDPICYADVLLTGGKISVVVARSPAAQQNSQPPAPTPVTNNNTAIYASVLKNVNVLSSKHIDDTDDGVLGCAWAVNEVVRQALGSPIDGTASTNGLSTDGIYDALNGGKGKAVTKDTATPGTVVISPTDGDTHGHVGFVGQGGLIYSNSSADGIFEQNYNLDTWDAWFQVHEKLQVLFYNVV